MNKDRTDDAEYDGAPFSSDRAVIESVLSLFIRGAVRDGCRIWGLPSSRTKNRCVLANTAVEGQTNCDWSLEGKLQSELNHARRPEVKHTGAGKDAVGIVLHGGGAVDRAIAMVLVGRERWIARRQVQDVADGSVWQVEIRIVEGVEHGDAGFKDNLLAELARVAEFQIEGL